MFHKQLVSSYQLVMMCSRAIFNAYTNQWTHCICIISLGTQEQALETPIHYSWIYITHIALKHRDLGHFSIIVPLLSCSGHESLSLIQTAFIFPASLIRLHSRHTCRTSHVYIHFRGVKHLFSPRDYVWPSELFEAISKQNNSRSRNALRSPPRHKPCPPCAGM